LSRTAGRGNTILGIDRGTFYRQARAFHGYLSAVSFILLMVFAATGILLNHPGWFGGGKRASEDLTVTLDKEAVAGALRAGDAPARLAALISGRTPVRGAYKSGEIVEGEANLRFEGVSGTTDAVVDLGTGAATVTVERATTVQILNDLHKGKNAGAVWSLVIDVGAGLVLLMSVLGYVIFFSLRFRLPTALALTAGSLLVLVGIYAAFVP
jgi:uncharacterized protein